MRSFVNSQPPTTLTPPPLGLGPEPSPRAAYEAWADPFSQMGCQSVIFRSDIARVACPLVSSFALPAVEPRLLLLDASGRCVLGLRRFYPSDDDVVQVAAALRVPFDVNLATRLTNATRLRRTTPGAVSWPEAHPYLTMLGLILPGLVFASLAVWVLDGFK